MKKNLIRGVLIIFIFIISILFAFVLNFNFISTAIIGDECKYDVEGVKTNNLFNLFYTMTSQTGYHPEPSYFNFGFTILIGLLIGCFLSILLFRRKIK